jgi:hypothetical protein
MSETTQEHVQNLVSQGYMTAVELATIVFVRILLSLPQGRDMLWRARCFMSEDLVCLRTDSSTRYNSSMAWSYII